MVGVVVLNYHEEGRTLRCLRSLHELEWPQSRLAIALVDNGSDDGFAAEVRSTFPAVRLTTAPTNLGFGGGCNLGFSVLGDCDHIALLNNDAVPDAGWLAPLVDALRRHPEAGAATPKVLLAGRFIQIELRCEPTRPGRGDPRSLGVQLCGARVGTSEVTADLGLVRGFWGWEHDETTIGGPFAWTDGHGVANLPLATSRNDPAWPVAVRLAAGTGPRTATITVGETTTTVEVGIDPRWFDVGSGRPVDVINNVGAELHPDGSVADRGYLEPDDGRHDEPGEVFGWSGAAVLLTRRYLDDVGLFDDRFFLYYEDSDLSWRGRLRGWTYRYEPASVVRHEHSATVGERSALVRHLSGRNRLLMLAKNAPLGLAAGAVRQALRELGLAVGRDVFVRLVRLERPVVAHASRQARVLLGFARLLPGTIRRRRRARSGGRVNDASILSWTVDR